MLFNLSIHELALLLQKKEISSADLVREVYEHIETLDGDIHSFVTIRDKKTTFKEAEEKDNARGEREDLLYGIPYALKDAYVTKDLPTTAGSKILQGFLSPYNATVYEKLRKKGAILIGKNSMDGWGHGGSSENTDYPIVRNPWDKTKIAGGSSGGSAAAVAARMVPFAIAEDTGGSIRNPASMCNISGLKVTYGRVSRYGAIAYASSLDTVGPMGKTAQDLAIILDTIAGADDHDMTSSLRTPQQYTNYLQHSLKGKRIGILKEFIAENLDKEIHQTLQKALQVFRNLGVEIVDISIPLLDYSIPIYYLIALSETSTNLARYDALRFGKKRNHFTAETVRRIIIGTYALSTGYSDRLYKKAQKARTVLINDFEKAFATCDVIFAPVMPGLPKTIGELSADPLEGMLEDLYTVTANVVGIPSLAIPAGFSSTGLPIGMQLMGKKFSENLLLQFGYQYQQVTDWHKRTPNVHTYL